MKKITLGCIAMPFAFLIFISCTSNLPERHGQLDIELFLGDSSNQSLIVGFGGSEGGNAWATDRWASTRQLFLDEGYAFLAIGYFGSSTTPNKLDRISLNAIHDSIHAIVKRHPQLNPKSIVLIGGSKGGELVLNLASRFEGYNAVVALVPSHVSFPALTFAASTSSWMIGDKEVAFVPATWSSIPPLLRNDLNAAFSNMLEDTDAVSEARIPMGKSTSTILLMSGTKDEMWPSTQMCEEIMVDLASANYPYYFEHIAYEGDHGEPLNHFDKVLEFIDAQVSN